MSCVYKCPFYRYRGIARQLTAIKVFYALDGNISINFKIMS